MRAIVVKIHGEFLDRVCVRRGKGQEVIHISRGEKDRERVMKGGSLGRLKRERKGDRVKKRQMLENTKENESKCCRWFDAAPYRDTHLTTHARRERFIYEC